MTIQQLLKTAPVTTLLLASFIGLFVMQLVTGVDANNPSTEALVKWGANALPLTMMDDPWRLASSAFLHIGLMHLLFNGFAMYFFGQIAEPLFGSAKFLALFLLAAIGGNLLNNYVTWQSILDGTGQPGLSAGASGGIMGIGAALLIAALFKISVNGMVLNLKSLIFIMGINLVYGFAVPGIDNAGHIGGAITGLIIALAFAIGYRQRLAVAIQNAAIQQQRTFNAYQTNYSYSAHDNPSFNSQYSGQHDNQSPYDATSIDQSPHLNSDSTEQDTVLANNETNVSDINANNSAESVTANNSPLSNEAVHNSIEPKALKKPSIIWQLLPWLAMLLISIGFVWWWQDIHQQLLQVLKAIE
ncbi:rhomboid family intramembrane serine protease [Psychrobacter sp. BI730]|uniref:rhomboid family intramembrane serine protease n=1 Tax=Psychrobacter sp. BI730 TaxID=2705463 RepID=UPI0015CB2B81|nr:rhomboid family intramembrane serine protease [Psychrobacter sp. BI730]NYR08664.1 rhomboid family intramembrane serine protease [Psychrobacter sp. BI730]